MVVDVLEKPVVSYRSGRSGTETRRSAVGENPTRVLHREIHSPGSDLVFYVYDFLYFTVV